MEIYACDTNLWPKSTISPLVRSQVARWAHPAAAAGSGWHLWVSGDNRGGWLQHGNSSRTEDATFSSKTAN